MGQSPSSATYNHDGQGIPFFQGKAEFGNVFPRVDKYCSAPKKIAKAGATLLSVRAPVGPTNLAKSDYCIGRGLAAIYPLDGISPRFILYLFRSIQSAISDKGTGSTFKAVNKTFLEELEFALPPLDEQRRIVARVEELFSELDKGVDSLKKARAQLKTYRQAVLKQAFEGKLTAKWREENRHKLEKPEQLLARIKHERAARHEQQIQEWKTAARKWEDGGKSGRKPRRPKKSAKLAGLPRDATDRLPSLPESWTWDRLGWMTCGVEYGTAAKSAKAGRTPVLRMGNIQNAKFDWSNLVYTSDDNEIADYSLHLGDVLFNRTNSPELVGKTAIYAGERPAVFAGYLIRVNHIRAVINSQYLNLFLNSQIARQHGNRVKTDGVNQSNINGAKLSNYPFPYCSIEEQHIIADFLETTFSLLEQTEANIVKQLQKADALRQSVLKIAFSGQLVPQNPKDEPASMLLERIKAEKSAPPQDNARKIRRRVKLTA